MKCIVLSGRVACTAALPAASDAKAILKGDFATLGAIA